MPYKFNGKEKDEETGLYYYSARYYDPMVAKFLTVDPLWNKYPNLSSYAYCTNNPLKFIDPTGMTVEEPEKNKKDFILIQKPKYSIVELAKNAGKGKHGKNKEYFEKSIIELATERKTNKNSPKIVSKTKNEKIKNGASLVNAVGVAATVAKNIEDITPVVKIAAKTAGYAGMFFSAYQFSEANSLESKLEYGLDFGVGAFGTFGGPVGAGFSIYWNVGGKELHKTWEQNVLTPQLENNVPAHAIMPFK